MRNTIIGLTFTSILLATVGGAVAADDVKKCTPHKPGYILDANGKCVKAPSMKPIKQ